MSADQLAGADRQVDPVDGLHAAEADVEARSTSSSRAVTGPSPPRRSRRAAPGAGRRSRRRARPSAPARPSGLSTAVTTRPRPPSSSVYSGPTPNHWSRAVNADAAGHEQPAEDGARDAGDPAEVGEGQQGDRGQAAEGQRRHRAEAVAGQDAAQPGDEGGEGEGEHLGAGHADAGGGRGPLVRPARPACADRCPSAAGARPRGRARRRRPGRTGRTTSWAGCRRADPGRWARSAGRGTGAAPTAAPSSPPDHAGFSNTHVLDGDRGGQRHDRQVHAPDPQGRDGGEEPEQQRPPRGRAAGRTGRARRARWPAWPG